MVRLLGILYVIKARKKLKTDISVLIDMLLNI